MIARLTAIYLAIFAVVLGVISYVAYWLVGRQYASMLAPAMGTSEGAAGYRAAMNHVALTIVGTDAPLLIAVGLLAYVLARSSLTPLIEARAREQQFAADAAHELRSPLATIATVAQAARLSAEPQTREALDTIARTALDASALIGDLLTLARDPRPGLLQSEPVDLANILATCAREFEPRFRAASIEFEPRVAGAIVDGDERRLRELVRNLLDNALRHARHRVIAECGGDSGDAFVRVSDDGEGVIPAVRERIFERFVRGNSNGSGLGLAIAHWIASAHGGSLILDGSAGVTGATFVARFPAVRA